MRTKGLSTPVLLASTLFLLSGCIGDGENRVLSIDAVGVVEGVVYFDDNGNRNLDPTDPPLPGVGVRLLLRATGDTFALATSDENGLYSIGGVAVGTYDLVVAASTVGDTADVVEIDPPQLTVVRDDSVASSIAVSYPIITLEEARALPPGERVFVEGIALNARITFRDGTVHIAGDSTAIRGTRVQATEVIPGDSARFQGTTARFEGQPVLDDVRVFILSVGDPPDPVRIGTVVAATADFGRLDAALVQVSNAEIITADLPEVGDGVLIVDDGSGQLEVLLDMDAPIVDTNGLTVGTFIDAVGLLVPTPGAPGTWRLKPRSDLDITISP